MRLLGSLSPRALAAWLARAAIYCLPARYEPFGLSVLEAALSGCALVLGDIPSLREIWDDARRLRAAGRSGRARERRSSAPDRRPGPPRRRSPRGSRARALQLTPDTMVDGYLAAYGEVLALRRRS